MPNCKVIDRPEPGKALILTATNELWLTNRFKRRHDGRRRSLFKNSVRFIPIERIPKQSDWLFTCSMEPRQFKHWEDGSDDFFDTMEGSSHSKKNCSLKLISTKYAEFFNQHKLWELFDIHHQNFDKYEAAVKKICEVYKIKYEGI